MDEVVEGTCLALLDGLKEVFRGFFGDAWQGEELGFGEGVEVGWIMDKTVVDEEVDEGFSEAFDIHGLARGEVQNTARDLRRALVGVGAFEEDAFPLEGCAAAWAVGGRGDGAFIPDAGIEDDTDDGRYDFAGFFDDDGIMDADVFAVDFIEVVESGSADAGAGEFDGLEFGYGGDDAGAPDLEGDRLEGGAGLGGSEFVGDGPAWGFAGVAEGFL